MHELELIRFFVIRLDTAVQPTLSLDFSAGEIGVTDADSSTPDVTVGVNEILDDSPGIDGVKIALYSILDNVQDSYMESTKMEWPKVDGRGGFVPDVELDEHAAILRAGYRSGLDWAWNVEIPFARDAR